MTYERLMGFVQNHLNISYVYRSVTLMALFPGGGTRVEASSRAALRRERDRGDAA
jgi:hypothetical protein